MALGNRFRDPGYQGFFIGGLIEKNKEILLRTNV